MTSANKCVILYIEIETMTHKTHNGDIEMRDAVRTIVTTVAEDQVLCRATNTILHPHSAVVVSLYKNNAELMTMAVDGAYMTDQVADARVMSLVVAAKKENNQYRAEFRSWNQIRVAAVDTDGTVQDVTTKF